MGNAGAVMGDRNTSHKQAVVQVCCESWEHFAKRYAADLEKGGLFVPCTEQLEMFEPVRVTLQLPEGHEVHLEAQVVHAVSVAQAAARGGAPGMGLQLSTLDPQRREGLAQLVAFARGPSDGQGAPGSSGSSGDNAGHAGDGERSFGAFLFERAVFVRPEAFGAALSAPPGPLPVPRPTITTARAVSGKVAIPGHASSRESARSGVRSAVRVGEGAPLPPGRPVSAVDSMKAPASSMMAPAGPVTAPESAAPSSGESRAPTEAADAWHPTRSPDALKEAMTHLAHRRYREAALILRKLAKSDRRDRDAYKWYFVVKAKQAIAAGDHDRAAIAYERALRLDDKYREAREFLRLHARRRRLSVIPFSKYFSK